MTNYLMSNSIGEIMYGKEWRERAKSFMNHSLVKYTNVLWKIRGLRDSWSKLHVNVVPDDWQLIVNCIPLTVNQQHRRSGDLHLSRRNRRTVDQSSIIRSNAFYHEFRINSGHSFPLFGWIVQGMRTGFHIFDQLSQKTISEINILFFSLDRMI